MSHLQAVVPAAPVPPQHLEAEESVLGAMMLAPSAIVAVRDLLQATDFYRESHARIYRAALHLADTGEPVDAITLTGELERHGELDQVGGRVRIYELAGLVPASGNAAHYAALVRDAAVARELIRTGGEIARLGWDRPGDTADLVARARELAAGLDNATAGTTALAVETWAQFERSATEQIPTIVADLWPEGGLGFIAAPPKKGKTWVGLDLAIAVATGTPFLNALEVPKAVPVVYLALEGHRAAIRGRIGALARGHGLNPDPGHHDLDQLHIVYKPVGLNLNDPAWIRTVRDTITATGARLIVVDVLRAAAVLKENSNDEFRDLLRAMQPLTDTGCAIALLHHYGKLTEISRDRSPGERMAGAGAMYGAFDVGVFITGSDDGARRLRIEFETRDVASPDPIGVYLAGEPTGRNGGFIYSDAAHWTVEAHAPDESDVKAPAHEIADYVRDQGGDVERRFVEAYFDISDKTLDRRLTRLEQLGIDLVKGRGRGTKSRLVARPEEPEQVRLDLPPESSESPASDSELFDAPSFTPLNHAETGDHPESPESLGVEHSEETEHGDLQGYLSSESSTSPTERQPSAGAEPPHREAWLDTIDPAADIDWTRP